MTLGGQYSDRLIDLSQILMTNYIKIQIKKRQNSHFPQII